MVYRFQPALIISARIVSGLLPAGASSMVSIAIAWGLFIFFISQSAQAWFILQLCAAGTGAALGRLAAWFNIDRNTRPLVALTGVVAILGGLAGAWSGYEYGAYRSAMCCEKSGATIFLSPVTYSAFGATVFANLVMLVFRLVRNRLVALERVAHRRHPMAGGADATKYRSANRWSNRNGSACVALS